MKREYSQIDPKIQPLVDALNGIPGISTIASCEGHFFRINHPYVYFHCPPALAEGIATRLHDLFMADALHRWWHLTGCFHPEYGLCFTLEAPALDHNCGLIKTFLNYVIFRKKIDVDLDVLSRDLKEFSSDTVNDRGEDAGLIGDIESNAGNKHDANAAHAVAPFSFGDAPERIRVTASGTRALDTGRNTVPTMAAGCRITHASVHSVPDIAKTLARRLSVVAFLAVTLSACAGNREIQKDGSGTDEMLKSPCVCAPVPYDAPGFKWVS